MRESTDTRSGNWLETALAAALSSPVDRLVPVAGGDVHNAYRAELANGGAVFVKTGGAGLEGLITEAASLAWLAEAEAVAVPKVLAVGAEEPGFLVLEWIDAVGRPDRTQDETFGRSLAALHASGPAAYGRHDGRQTGSRRLPNRPAETWVDFYRSNRLIPLARLAGEANVLTSTGMAGLERITDQLDRLVGPDEPPARLHGDLWAGNRLVDRGGVSWLIDPASFGGHREFDLAMMALFGGFSPACFAAYREVAPLADGWEDRVGLYQLAPLLVHAIKFGGHYLGALADAIDRLI